MDDDAALDAFLAGLDEPTESNAASSTPSTATTTTASSPPPPSTSHPPDLLSEFDSLFAPAAAGASPQASSSSGTSSSTVNKNNTSLSSFQAGVDLSSQDIVQLVAQELQGPEGQVTLHTAHLVRGHLTVGSVEGVASRLELVSGTTSLLRSGFPQLPVTDCESAPRPALLRADNLVEHALLPAMVAALDAVQDYVFEVQSGAVGEDDDHADWAGVLQHAHDLLRLCVRVGHCCHLSKSFISMVRLSQRQYDFAPLRERSQRSSSPSASDTLAPDDLSFNHVRRNSIRRSSVEGLSGRLGDDASSTASSPSPASTSKAIRAFVLSEGGVSTAILTALRHILAHDGPDAYFSFLDTPLFPLIKPSIGHKGYTWCTWIRLARVRDTTSNLFSFLTDSGTGVQTYVRGRRLTIRSLPEAREAVPVPGVSLKPERWYFLALVHAPASRASSSHDMVLCYVNGELVSGRNFGVSYPRLDPHTPLQCTLGGFEGQVGPFHLLANALGPRHVRILYMLGPRKESLPTIHLGYESPVAAFQSATLPPPALSSDAGMGKQASVTSRARDKITSVLSNVARRRGSTYQSNVTPIKPNAANPKALATTQAPDATSAAETSKAKAAQSYVWGRVITKLCISIQPRNGGGAMLLCGGWSSDFEHPRPPTSASPPQQDGLFSLCSEPHTIKLNGVRTTVLPDARGNLRQVGGVEMLLLLTSPLLQGRPFRCGSEAASVLLLITECIRRSVVNQRRLIALGLKSLRYLVLDPLKPAMRTKTVVAAIKKLAVCVYNLDTSYNKGHFFRTLLSLLLDFSYWKSAPVDAQLQVAKTLRYFLEENASLFVDVPAAGVITMLDNVRILCAFSFRPPKSEEDEEEDAEAGAHAPWAARRWQAGQRRGSQAGSNAPAVLDVARELLTCTERLSMNTRLPQAEMESFVSLVEDCSDPRMAHLLLEALLRVGHAMPDRVFGFLLSEAGDYRALLDLLQCPDEAVRILALKLIGRFCFARYDAAKERGSSSLSQFRVFLSSLTALLGEKLLAYEFTPALYNVLLEIVSGRITPASEHVLMVDETVELHYPAFLSVALKLASDESTDTPCHPELQQRVLMDLLTMLRLQQQETNLHKFITAFFWQRSLAEFLKPVPVAKEELVALRQHAIASPDLGTVSEEEMAQREVINNIVSQIFFSASWFAVTSEQNGARALDHMFWCFDRIRNGHGHPDQFELIGGHDYLRSVEISVLLHIFQRISREEAQPSLAKKQLSLLKKAVPELLRLAEGLLFHNPESFLPMPVLSAKKETEEPVVVPADPDPSAGAEDGEEEDDEGEEDELSPGDDVDPTAAVYIEPARDFAFPSELDLLRRMLLGTMRWLNVRHVRTDRQEVLRRVLRYIVHVLPRPNCHVVFESIAGAISKIFLEQLTDYSSRNMRLVGLVLVLLRSSMESLMREDTPDQHQSAAQTKFLIHQIYRRWGPHALGDTAVQATGNPPAPSGKIRSSSSASSGGDEETDFTAASEVIAPGVNPTAQTEDTLFVVYQSGVQPAEARRVLLAHERRLQVDLMRLAERVDFNLSNLAERIEAAKADTSASFSASLRAPKQATMDRQSKENSRLLLLSATLSRERLGLDGAPRLREMLEQFRIAFELAFGNDPALVGDAQTALRMSSTGELSVVEPDEDAPVCYRSLDTTEAALRMRYIMKPEPNGTSHPEATVVQATSPLSRSRSESSTDLLATVKVKQVRSAVDAGEGVDEDVIEEEEAHEQGGMDDNELGEDDVFGAAAAADSSMTEAPAADRPGRLGASLFECKDTLWVSPLHRYEGVLTLFENALVFVGQEQVEEDGSDAGAGGGDENEEAELPDMVRLQWMLPEIRQVLPRRYLLRESAVEIFLRESRNYFFNVGKVPRNELYRQLCGRLRLPMELSPTRRLQRSGLTRRWQNRQISNFEYLMRLNTLAGRSFNDLTQYPVFPWILTDFESETLDLDDPSVYRDLSKPIGALNEDRWEIFAERFEGFQDDTIPAFHYGSHYSSAGIALHYLLRLEPFTTLAIRLQGGRFDLPDRLFGSVAGAWKLSYTNVSDVKELIPEFFYLPDFLQNSHRLDLGCKQDTGARVDDVVLPPWAHGSAEEFIRIHREALESEHVTCMLPAWIDLVFGYKQQGPEAIEARNLFYYLTYAGNVDIDSIEDPAMRAATEAQIAHFGQTPSQLFLAPHPAAHDVSPPAHIALPAEESLKLRDWVIVQPRKPRGRSKKALKTAQHGQITAVRFTTSGTVVTVTDTLVMQTHSIAYYVSTLPSPYDEEVAESDAAAAAAAPAVEEEDVDLVEHHPPTELICTHWLDTSSTRGALACVSKHGKFVLTGGFSDASIKAFYTRRGGAQAVSSATFHRDTVTCMRLCGHVMISGSRDGSVLCWLPLIEQQEWKRPALLNIPAPAGVQFCAHQSAVLDVDVHPQAGMAISVSESEVAVYSLASRRFLRSLPAPVLEDSRSRVELKKGVLLRDGRTLVVSGCVDSLSVLLLFTVNGKLLAVERVQSAVTALKATAKRELFVVGDTTGEVSFRFAHNLQVAQSFVPSELELPCAVADVDVAPNERHFVVAYESQHVVLFDLPNSARGSLFDYYTGLAARAAENVRDVFWETVDSATEMGKSAVGRAKDAVGSHVGSLSTTVSKAKSGIMSLVGGIGKRLFGRKKKKVQEVVEEEVEEEAEEEEADEQVEEEDDDEVDDDAL